MKKKYAFAGIGIVVLAVLSFFLFFRGSARKYDFRFDKVSTGDITMVVTATGTVNPVVSVDVGTQVSGIVSKLYADYNSVVKQGQVIAQIDPTFLEQSVKDADAALDRAKAQDADSKRTLAREKALLAKGLDSQLNYDAALTTAESNAAALKQARATLDRAKINLAYATIYAPISGVVINRAVNLGQTVAASFSSPTLYTIANDLKKMQVETTVDESDIGNVSIGQDASFSVDAYPEDSFKGTVAQIRLAPVSVQNVINYTVIIRVNNDDLRLMPGMTANVKLVISSAHNALKVPNMALRFQPPGDLIDSTKLMASRQEFGGRGSAEGSSGTFDTSKSRNSTTGAAASGNKPNDGVSDARRAMFMAVRDSIERSRGGNMDQNELMTEVRKVMASRMGGNVSKPVAELVPAPTGDKANYGITPRFPEYEKSMDLQPHHVGRGRIWVLNASGKLEPLSVRTGVTDGRFTEITSSSLKTGDQIVLGASATGDAVADTKSPLTGGQARPGGGGFR